MAIASRRKKGSIYAFEVVARRAGSECDPVLRLLDAKGSIVTEADDTRGTGQGLTNRMEGPGGRRHTCSRSPTCTTAGGRHSATCSWPRRPRPDFTLDVRPRHDQRRPWRARAGLRPRDAAAWIQRRGRLSWDGLPAGVSASPLAIARR